MASLARICVRHRWWVIVGWCALVIALLMAAGRTGDDHRSSMLFEGTESAAAAELVAARFPDAPGEPVQIVMQANAPLTSERARLDIWPMFEAIESIDSVAAFSVPWADNRRELFSVDGRTAIATVVFDTEAAAIPIADMEALLEIAENFSTDDLLVRVGGAAVDVVLQPGPGENEQYALIAAALILLIAFGSVVAAGLPIAVAGAGVMAGLASVTLTTHVVSIPAVGAQLAALIGLGVGIDYALFIVTRFRTALEQGSDPREAVVTSMASSGRAVAVAGSVVIVSLAGLVLVGVEFVSGLAVAASIGVFFTLTSSLTLLPALLAVSGRAVNRLRFGSRRPQGLIWRRWTSGVQRRPVLAAVLGLLLVGLLAAPAAQLRLGTVDAGVNSPDSSTRQAYDIVTAELGPGENGPLAVVVDLLPRATPNEVRELADQLRTVAGVARVGEPAFDFVGATAVFEVAPIDRPDAVSTEQLLSSLRDGHFADFEAATGAEVLVGGTTAAFVDQSTVLGGRLPWVIASVLLVSFALLAVTFRGLVVALKAVVLNLLSVAAAYGVVVMVFQWGWGLDLIGLDRTGPVIAFAPILLFALLFGLSMDYEVFVLSRVREEWKRHGDTDRAVVEGLASTGRVITAAGAIMVAVFGSFVLSVDPVLKLFGVGLASAILIDVTLVRALLVPSLMSLFGGRNWWMPAFIERRLPQRSTDAELEIDLTDSASGSTVDDPYLVALATGHSTHGRAVGLPHGFEEDAGLDHVDQPTDLPALFQAIALVEDDNAEVLRDARGTSDPDLLPTLDLAVLFSERHRDMAIDRVDDLVLLGAPPPEAPIPRTDPASQSLTGRARRTEHLWRVAERFLDADRVEIVSATTVRWWLRRSSSQWRELGRCGLLQPAAGVLPPGVQRMYHLIAETEHLGAVALYRIAELVEPEVARLADRRRGLAKLFRDRLAELDDRSPIPPAGEFMDAVPASVPVGSEMTHELLDHPVDGALVEWYRREVTDVMAQVRAFGLPIDEHPLDPARLPLD